MPAEDSWYFISIMAPPMANVLSPMPAHFPTLADNVVEAGKYYTPEKLWREVCSCADAILAGNISSLRARVGQTLPPKIIARLKQVHEKMVTRSSAGRKRNKQRVPQEPGVCGASSRGGIPADINNPSSIGGKPKCNLKDTGSQIN